MASISHKVSILRKKNWVYKLLVQSNEDMRTQTIWDNDKGIYPKSQTKIPYKERWKKENQAYLDLKTGMIRIVRNAILKENNAQTMRYYHPSF